MLMTSKKIDLLSFTRKAILIGGLLFFSFHSHAQEEEKITDTTETTTTEEDYSVDESTSGTGFDKRSDTLIIEPRRLSEDEVRKLKEDDAFWYANADLKKKRSSEQTAYEKEHGKKGKKGNEDALEERDYVPLGQRTWVQTLLWIIIVGGFAAFLVVYLSGSNVGLFRRKNRGTSSGEEEIISEDIFAINYQKEIDKAAAQGNYRLAIRLMFLRLLKNMSEKNIIRYKQDKTNLDYLQELSATGYYSNFFRVTRNYEYSWYGQFPVTENAYTIIRNDFDQFDKELR